MRTLFTLLAVALLGGCAARQPVPLTLAELDEQEQAYKTDVAKMSIPELCSEYRSQGSTKYRARFKKVASAEIVKRNVWSKIGVELDSESPNSYWRVRKASTLFMGRPYIGEYHDRIIRGTQANGV